MKYMAGWMAALLAACLLLQACGAQPASTSAVAGASHTASSVAPHTVWEAESASPQQSLPVENIPQLPQLPNGCEATALATMLGFFGYDVDKTELAGSYIPRQGFIYKENGRVGPDPSLAYAGNPADSTGYYCFAPPVVQGASAFLAAQNAPLMAEDITGADEDTLVRLLTGGLPVMVWVTRDEAPPKPAPDLAWLLDTTGEEYHPYRNLHVVVLRGYTDTDFLLCDPLAEKNTLSRATLMQLYRQMGSRAMVIGPKLT